MIRLLSAWKQRLVPAGAAVRTIRGGLLRGVRMSLDLSHQTQLYLGLYERELHPWFRTFSRHLRTAIDVGAHEGVYTLYFLTRTPAQTVLVFEPSAPDRQRLQANLAVNGLAQDGRLQFFPQFVGAEPSTSTCTLDSFLPRIAAPCLVKVDVEGAEVDVLLGAQRLLALPQLAWIIETHAASLETRCREILRTHGFSTTIVRPAWWRCLVPEQRPAAHNRWLIAYRPGATS